MDNSNDNKYFLCLDGFRGICVSWVMIMHLSNAFPLFPPQSSIFSKALIRLCELGYLGVHIFFVISGFLIAGLLLEEISGNIRIRRFYIRRAFKIFPQYFLVVCVGIILTVAYSNEQYDFLSYLSCFLLVQNYVPPLLIFMHLWSIAVEEHFYLFLPLVLWVVCRSSTDLVVRKRNIIILFVSLIVLGNWVRAVSLKGLTSEEISSLALWGKTHIVFDALIFGCLIRAIYSFSDGFQRHAGIIRKWLWLIGGALAIYIFSTMGAVQWFDYTLIYLSAGCFILSGVLGFQPLVLILESPVLKWIGRNSYGIYLWHISILCVIQMWSKFLRNEWLILLYFLLTFLLGVGMTQTVEKKFLNIRRQLFP